MASKSSEEVLLIISHVKYKKVDGSLYVMSTRLAWMNQSADTFKISAAYEDTRVQRISPDNKDKVQLQLLMNDGTSYTFQFANPTGKNKQLEDRNSVKELLQQLLPKFKDKIHSELEEKRRILIDNPELMSLYKDLVVTNIMSVDEFWSQPDIQQLLRKEPQLIGVPTHLLGDIKPQVDGVNGTKYNLTGETIDTIFRAYPAVRQKHLELVPHKVSESDFWVKFFQSHYFHKDRLHITKDDLFYSCANADENQVKSEVLNRLQWEPLLDLRRFVDSDIGEGFGLQSDNASTSDQSISSGAKLTMDANHQLIRRFNHHSLMILNSQDQSSTSSAANVHSAVGEKRPKSMRSQIQSQKRAKLKEKAILDELSNNDSSESIGLNLDRIDVFLAGPTLPTRGEAASEKPPLLDRIYAALHDWEAMELNKCITGQSALQALSQISAGEFENNSGSSSSTIKTSNETIVALLGQESANELTKLYQSLSELLRHFWLSFPITSQQLAEKVERLHESLLKFRNLKLEPFKSSSNFRQDHIGVADHLDILIDTALYKYTTYKTKKKHQFNAS